MLLARGEKLEEGKTYEGAAAAASMVALARHLKVKLDLCEAINQILTQKFSAEEVRKIISNAILH